MSIKSSIKNLKNSIQILRKQLTAEQKTLIIYKQAVEKYKDLCKHVATKQELESAVLSINTAWHEHQLIKKYAHKRYDGSQKIRSC